MDFKFGEEVVYAGQKAKIKGIIPAYFQVGFFPEGIDDIDIRYMESDWDKSRFEGDTVLIEVENKLIRVSPCALEVIETKTEAKKKVRSIRAKSSSIVTRDDAKKTAEKEKEKK